MRLNLLDSQAKKDLWEQFSDEIADPDETPTPALVKKSSATDGSEWSGQFDRRMQPRDNASESDDQAPDDQAAQASGSDDQAESDQASE